MSSPKTVLVFSPYCPKSIGEQVVQLPLFHALRSKYPDARVIAAVPPDSSHVLRALKGPHDFAEYPLDKGPFGFLKLWKNLNRLRPDMTLQIRMHSFRTSIMAKLVTRGSVAGFEGDVTRLQDHTYPFPKSRYISQLYLNLLGTEMQSYSEAVRLPSDDYALVVPLGLRKQKHYPIEQWQQVAGELSRRMPVRFLVGPGMDTHKSRLEAGGFLVHAAPPIDQLEELVARARLVLSNDCGPGHFAQIRDVPRVAVFDASVEWEHWSQPGPRSRVLRGPEPGRISSISPDLILEAAAEVLSAR